MYDIFNTKTYKVHAVIEDKGARRDVSFYVQACSGERTAMEIAQLEFVHEHRGGDKTKYQFDDGWWYFGNRTRGTILSIGEGKK